jgi:hypothetical protein
MDHFLATYASINCFTQYRAENSLNGDTYTWPIRTGEASADLTRDLLNHPRSYSFFQAVRLLRLMPVGPDQRATTASSRKRFAFGPPCR